MRFPWYRHTDVMVDQVANATDQAASRTYQVICKSFPESLGFESMKGHEKQPRLGIVWQDQSHPEERPGEVVGKGTASVRVGTDTGDARTMRFLRMLMTDVEWARLSR